MNKNKQKYLMVDVLELKKCSSGVWDEEKNSRKALKRYKMEYRNKGMK